MIRFFGHNKAWLGVEAFLALFFLFLASTWANRSIDLEVGSLDGTLRFEDKSLDYRIYFPKTGGSYPVIVFSHGFGGSKESFSLLGRFWASRGYVVIHPSHGDSMAKIGEGSRVGSVRGRLRTAISQPDNISKRVGDITLILDSLDYLNSSVVGLSGKINPKSVGLAGHSFGAYIAMLLGGVSVSISKEGGGNNLYDPRVKCLLLVSPQGTGQQGLTKESYKTLAVPTMFVTGTRDRGVGGQDVSWRKEPYGFAPLGDKYLLVIEGANHFSFGGGLRGESSQITKTLSFYSDLFWESYLKESINDKRFLRTFAGQSVKEGAVLSYK